MLIGGTCIFHAGFNSWGKYFILASTLYLFNSLDMQKKERTQISYDSRLVFKDNRPLAVWVKSIKGINEPKIHFWNMMLQIHKLVGTYNQSLRLPLSPLLQGSHFTFALDIKINRSNMESKGYHNCCKQKVLIDIKALIYYSIIHCLAWYL